MSMIDNFVEYFSTTFFMPHGHCYLWKPALLILQVGSDAAIALSYMLIPLTLIYFVHKRKDVPFGWVFMLFCTFILACGFTHIMEIWTVWRPDYWLSGFVKLITGIVSLTTAILLIRYIPDILALPTVDTILKANVMLEKSEAKFRSFIEGAPDATIITDKSGTIVGTNAQTVKIFGYTKEEIIGQKVEFLMPERFRHKHVGNRNDFIGNPHTRPMGADLALFGLRKDGSEFPVEISLSPVETEEGTFVMAAIRDVTDKKNIEKLLIEKNVELVNSDLAKDQFLTHMSHELRTPLNGIIVMTQMLMAETDLKPTVKEQLDIINESNQQLLAVINQILDFSKVESGYIGIDQTEFETKAAIEKIVAPYKIKAESKHIKVNYHIASNVPDHLIGDLVKLKQILSNLLDNAVKFTEQGNVQLMVTANDKDNALTNIVFEVSDSGIGIKSDILPKLFKPFSQGDSSMTRKYGGTGLGLAISKRLVEVLGGTIEVVSDSSGSRFILTVPFMHNQEIKIVKPAMVTAHETSPSASPNKSKILLVEDNKLNQRTLTLVLNKLGFTVVLANDGIEALRTIANDKFDMILMDCQMPNMDGYKTTMQIRKSEEGTGHHIPIIGVTAHAMEGNRNKCLDAGMDNYISKPYSIADLNKIIKKYVYTNGNGGGE